MDPIYRHCPFCDDFLFWDETYEKTFKRHFERCKDLSHIEPMVLYEDDSMIREPLHPEMCFYICRFNSLIGYEESVKIKYANSGFYYTGVADIVACFWCGVHLACWSSEDPLVEHVKHFPKCLYAAMAWTRDPPVDYKPSSNVISIKNLEFPSYCIFCQRDFVKMDHILKCCCFVEDTRTFEGKLLDNIQNTINIVPSTCWSTVNFLRNKKVYEHFNKYVTCSGNIIRHCGIEMRETDIEYYLDLGLKKRDVPLPSTINQHCPFCGEAIHTLVSHFWLCPDLMKKHMMFTYEPDISPRYSKMMDPLDRLQSFKNWPNCIKKMIGPLVMSGFFYDGDIIKCFYCGGAISEWNDDPLEKHAKLFPNCLYADWYFNIKHPIKEMYNNMHEEVQRLKTFDSWSGYSNVLAEMGFYYSTGGRIQCAFCKLIINDCMSDIFRIHQWKSPKCPMILGKETNNVPLKIPWEIVINGPCNVEMENFFKRLNTFKNWFSEYQCEQNLAECGFYYTGEKDMVECFWCGGKWPSSDCMTQHLKESRCLFAIYNQEKREEEKQVSCKACFEKECEILFLECGHLACCEPCSKLIDKCIICRSLITRKIRAYI